jgi:hypothetical protein
MPRLRMSRSYTSSPPQAPPWRVAASLYLYLYLYPTEKIFFGNAMFRHLLLKQVVIRIVNIRHTWKILVFISKHIQAPEWSRIFR